MNPADLQRLARLGEGYHLEFKRRISSPVRIAREAIAFANTWGGAILVGVDDDGTVVGVKDAQEEIFDLERAFNENCDPPVQFSLDVVPVSRKREVIVANIDASDKKPHKLVDPESPASEVFVRVDEHSVTASPEMIELLRHENNDQGVHFEFGDKELLLLRFLETYESISVERYATIAGISRPEASTILVTLARARVLRLVAGEKGDTFVINHNGQATAS